MLQFRQDYYYEYQRDPLNQHSREKGMATTLSFIAEKVYSQEKIIVWAHNGHIATQVPYYQDVLPMGGYLKNQWNDQLFTIRFFTHRGSNVTDVRTKVPEQVKPPCSGSLEELSYIYV
jgi:erythromycin esterase